MKGSPRKIALDTSVIVALLSTKDPFNRACCEALKKLPETTSVFTTESCLAETSYILPDSPQLRNSLKELLILLSVGIFPLDQQRLHRVYELQDKYGDLPMDFADATLVVACEQLEIRDILTLDRKDFSIYRPLHCKALQIHPEL